MEEIKHAEPVAADASKSKAGRPRLKLTGEQLKKHLKELRAGRNKRHHAKHVSESLSNAEALMKHKVARKESWLAIQETKQRTLLQDAIAKGDVDNEISYVKKRLVKNDNRLLDMAVDVEDMVGMLKNMKVWLDRAYDVASKASKKAH